MSRCDNHLNVNFVENLTTEHFMTFWYNGAFFVRDCHNFQLTRWQCGMWLNSQTGTLRFISQELLRQRPTCAVPYDFLQFRRPVNALHHTAIHDIESFYSILLYLSITRDSPGRPKEELKKKEPLSAPPAATIEAKDIHSAGLRQAVLLIFDHPNKDAIAPSKHLLLSEDGALETLLSNHLSSYLTPLKDTLIKWRELLYSSYHLYDEVEDGPIHLKTLKILDEALSHGKLEELESSDLKSTSSAPRLKRDSSLEVAEPPDIKKAKVS